MDQLFVMYSFILVLHSWLRWALFLALILVVLRSLLGLTRHSVFSALDNGFRHWTATLAHVQWAIGMLVYIKSPLVQYYFSGGQEVDLPFELTFFAIVHPLLMFTAVVLITIGSAKAKRLESDHLKFKTVFITYLLALIVIIIAIPWPFSPFALRPYFRTF